MMVVAVSDEMTVPPAMVRPLTSMLTFRPSVDANVSVLPVVAAVVGSVRAPSGARGTVSPAGTPSAAIGLAA